MTDQEPDRGKRKRPYCQRVICGVCKKEVDSDYKDNHAKTFSFNNFLILTRLIA